MLRKFVLISILICSSLVFISSCKKNNKKNNQLVTHGESSLNYMPGTIGSYWIYMGFSVDTNGVETAIGSLDSMWIDSIIEQSGHQYIRYRHSNVDVGVGLYADSGVYIISNTGIIQFTTSTDTTLLLYSNHNFFDSGFEIISHKFNRSTREMSLPIGPINAHLIENQSIISDKSSGTQKVSCWEGYCKGIGKVQYEYAFLGSLSYPPSKIRYSLLRYKL